jgi:hypothetical protein
VDDDPNWRNAALVAEWGLSYYRGEVAAMDRIAQTALDRTTQGKPPLDGAA